MVLGILQRACSLHTRKIWSKNVILPGSRHLKIATAAKVIATTMDQPHGSLLSEFPRSSLLNFDAVPEFKPKRVVVLTKITRYEFESEKHSHLDEEELTRYLQRKGSDYQALRDLHDYHKNQADKIVRALRARGIEAHLVNRYEYGAEAIDWADAVISAGGDGTFLLGASKLKDSNKPLIGINTDPRRSEGYLCLPKSASTDFAVSLDRLLNGQFKWFYRQRIRIELSGPNALDPPVELHEQQLDFPEHRFADWAFEHPDESDSKSGAVDSRETSPSSKSPVRKPVSHKRVLPEVALNEVFIGESLSSRVSYYEISTDNMPSVKQKSSGVTICTGTGSTSWSFNINKLTQQATASIIRIIRASSGLSVPNDKEYANLVTKRFNDELLFDPSDLRMVYTVRDPVSNTTYSTSNPRGYAQKVTIKSRCFDAALVIDGGPSYKFNDGAEVTLTMHADDALRTVQFT